MALDALKAYAEAQNQQSNNKPSKHEPEPVNKILTAQMDREKQSQNPYKKMAENNLKSERLRCKITKDVKAGADILDILTDCIKCISLMTGDTAFYEQSIKALREI